jgi:hypothetical protein
MSRIVTLASNVVGTSLAESVANPEQLLESPNAELVKNHRRTAVARVALAGRDVYVKRFKPYAWYRRIEALFGGGPARRSWHVASRIAARGFAPAPLLAMVETSRQGIPADSYLVTAAVDGAVPAARFWLEDAHARPLAERRRFLREVGGTLRRLHDAGFYSRDANADNFLVRFGGGGELEFWLIDLETLREVGHVSHRRRVKNLAQLHNLLRGRISAPDRIRVLEAYLGERREGLRELAEGTIVLDRRKAREYTRRRERRR